MNDITTRSMPDAASPLTATEIAVAELWRETLQMTDWPAPTDDFFRLGGDSMTMTMVEFRIREELSIDLPPDALFGAPSLRELSALIDAKRCDSDST